MLTPELHNTVLRRVLIQIYKDARLRRLLGFKGGTAALLTRKTFASRDMYDLWFFLHNNWSIDETVIKEKTGLTLQQALEKAIEVASGVSEQDLKHGLGELLSNRQKDWVRSNLREELVIQLRLYLEEVKS